MGVVAECLHGLAEVLTGHENGQLTAVEQHQATGQGGDEFCPASDDGVEGFPEGALGLAGHGDLPLNAAIPGGVAGAAAPHTSLRLKHRSLGGVLLWGDLAGGLGHRMSPFSSWVAGAARAASSRAAMAAASFGPIGRFATSSRSLNMASISMSGRGGQPGT